MTACRDMREEISAYVDGELSGAGGEKVRAHLETCAACRALAGRMRAVGTAVERIEAEPSDAFREALFGRLEREELLPRRRSLFFFSWRWFAVPAAVAAAVALIVLSRGPSPGPGAPGAGPSRVAAIPGPPPGAGAPRPSAPESPGKEASSPAGSPVRPGETATATARPAPKDAAVSASLSAEDRDILAYLEILENPQMLEEPSPLEEPGDSVREAPAGGKG